LLAIRQLKRIRHIHRIIIDLPQASF